MSEEIFSRDVIKKIGSKEIDPLTLKRETRLACVETLILDGHQQASIAQFLKRSDRTIRRDIEEIRKDYSIKRDAGFTNNLLAEFMFNSKVSIAHLSKLARSNEASIAEKSRAEALVFKMNKEIIQELCYLGLLVIKQEIEKEENNEQKSSENEAANSPLSKHKRQIVDNIKSLDQLEQMILVDRIRFMEKGLASKSRFKYADSNGEKIMNDLLEKGILEIYDAHKVRLKARPDVLNRPEEIAGPQFDIIWQILKWPFDDELEEEAKQADTASFLN